MQNNPDLFGGEVTGERSGPDGSVFKLFLLTCGENR
jgi:hypothetical protein